MQLNSKIHAADNSGARRLRLIQKISTKRKVGLTSLISVRRSKASSNYIKGQKERAMFVRQKDYIQRKDGSFLRFGNTQCILLNKRGEPKGKRLYGPVSKEAGLRRMKILTKKVF